MLFNSYEFILLFLPAVLLVFRQLTRFANQRLALYWLIVASLAFYSWQSPQHLWLLLASVIGNFTVSRLLVARPSPHWRRTWLALGVMLNLLPLAWFKYAGFVLHNLQAIDLLNHITWQAPPLPLAISFFTFQQIAFLADAYRRGQAQRNFADYLFCVIFFPHLIAGPLVYYREFLQQLQAGRLRTPRVDDSARGLVLFILGLAKKVLIGDNLGLLVDPLFGNSAGPQGALDAWMGSILYGFQIYFDFSAYSDMAIGLACLFGLRLPLNFDSPYQSVTYREFWRRWHITLFRFFRDHLYRPLLDDSTSEGKRFFFTFLVFFLSGLWHGAAWTFVAWGVVTWILVVFNDFWLYIANITGLLKRCPRWLATASGRLFVFCAWSWTIMVFRARDFDQVKLFLQQAFHNISAQDSVILRSLENLPAYGLLQLVTPVTTATCLAIITLFLLWLVWCMPNAVRWLLGHEKEYCLSENTTSHFCFSARNALYIAALLWASLLALPHATRFIYFQF